MTGKGGISRNKTGTTRQQSQGCHVRGIKGWQRRKSKDLGERSEPLGLFRNLGKREFFRVF